MQTINARDLRNDYARILKEAEAGESFTVLSRGRVVARIMAPEPEDLNPQDSEEARLATRRAKFSSARLGEVAGALHGMAGAPFDAAALRRDMADVLDLGVRDPFEDGGSAR